MMFETRESFKKYIFDAINNPDRFSYQIGIELTKMEHGYAEAELTVKDYGFNIWGFVHGGTLSTLADTVTGVAAASVGRECVTLNSNIQYIKSVKEGKAKAISKVIKEGRTVSVFNVDVFDETGDVVLSGTFTFYMLDRIAPEL